MACVTLEHVVPQSLGGKYTSANIAPSHWRCNMLRGASSLFAATKKIDKVAMSLSAVDFERWLNAKVPGRKVPWYALVSILDAEWFCV